MDELQLLMDLHREGRRQGPGSDLHTERALELGEVDRTAPLKVADIGCGTGSSALLLARLLNARITAVDFLPEFLTALEERARSRGVADRITTLARSMDDLPFADHEYDIIWSEGAIYNIGFAKGVQEWRRYLKPGGLLVASEITWLTDSRPRELQEFWEAEYPEIDTAAAKMQVLERNGYAVAGYFVLPERCWTDEYYRPLESRFADFLARHRDSEQARAVVAAGREEIAHYEKHKAHFSYGVYIARKLD